MCTYIIAPDFSLLSWKTLPQKKYLTKSWHQHSPNLDLHWFGQEAIPLSLWTMNLARTWTSGMALWQVTRTIVDDSSFFTEVWPLWVVCSTQHLTPLCQSLAKGWSLDNVLLTTRRPVLSLISQWLVRTTAFFIGCFTSVCQRPDSFHFPPCHWLRFLSSDAAPFRSSGYNQPSNILRKWCDILKNTYMNITAGNIGNHRLHVSSITTRTEINKIDHRYM